MKRLVSITLAFIILISSATCLADTSLDDCVSSFTIKEILANLIPPKPSVNFGKVIVPETNENPLLAVQYIDGVVTGITTVDISSSTTAEDVKLPYKKTPDEIRFFIWDNNNLKPLYKSVDALTPEVIETANKSVVNELELLKKNIDYLLRNYISGKEFRAIFATIDACATQALSLKDKHLLTSEYAIRINEKALADLKVDLKAVPKNQKEKTANNLREGFQKDEEENQKLKDIGTRITRVATFLNISDILKELLEELLPSQNAKRM